MSIFVSTHDASSSLSTQGSYSSWQELDRVPATEAAQQETPSGPSLAEPADPCLQELSLLQTTHCPSHLQLRCDPSQLMRQLPRALAGSSQEAEVVEQRRGHTWSWAGTVMRGCGEPLSPQAPEHLRHPSFWTPWVTMLSSKRDGHWGRAGQPKSTYHGPALCVAIRSGT